MKIKTERDYRQSLARRSAIDKQIKKLKLEWKELYDAILEYSITPEYAKARGIIEDNYEEKAFIFAYEFSHNMSMGTAEEIGEEE